MANETKNLFRKRARDRLSAPEQLDRTLSVTSARGWIAVLTIFVVAVVVGVWSFVGEIATYVDAHGFLLNRGGKVVDSVSGSYGRLSAVSVSEGDRVEQDAVVATVVNEEAAERYASALALIEDRKKNLETLKTAIAEETAIARANDVRRRQHLDQLETAALEILETARNQVEDSKQLLEKQIIARVDLENSQQVLNQARRNLIELGWERDNLEANGIRRENSNTARIREMEAQVQAAERQAKELEIVVAAGQVLAPVSGQVIEIKATNGAIVQPGQSVVSIRTGAADLEVLLYVPPADGKRVEPGMQALVSPSTVRREEFGSLRGTVESISSFPVSIEGMVAVLQNQNLVGTFSKKGPPYAGRISLKADPETASGFAWTSPKASSQELSAGTLASVEIKTRSQPPITLAVPLFKELLGLR